MQSSSIELILKMTNTIAVVGFSSRRHKAGYYVPVYLKEQGYKIFPINPFLTEGLDEKAYPDLKSISMPIDLVLLFRRSENVSPFVDQAIEIGAKAIWLQLGIRNETAVSKASAAGLTVVQDACMLVEHKQRKKMV